jgi:hypothetical protein
MICALIEGDITNSEYERKCDFSQEQHTLLATAFCKKHVSGISLQNGGRHSARALQEAEN